MSDAAVMESAGHYIYVRHTDTSGKRCVREYRVWNTKHALFCLSRDAEAENKKARENGEKAMAMVESIDESTYIKEKSA